MYESCKGENQSVLSLKAFFFFKKRWLNDDLLHLSKVTMHQFKIMLIVTKGSFSFTL